MGESRRHNPALADALIVLRERRDWLTARIQAKRSIGWDVEWDTRERDALDAVLAVLMKGGSE